MTKKTKDWWVSQTHMYSREVGELRDLLEKKTLELGDLHDLLERKNQIAEATIAKIKQCADEIERLRKALQLIANNTCCDGCQEAALVARKALGGE